MTEDLAFFSMVLGTTSFVLTLVIIYALGLLFWLHRKTRKMVEATKRLQDETEEVTALVRKTLEHADRVFKDHDQ